MSRRLLALGACAWACAPALPPPPELQALSPARIRQGEATGLSLSGAHLRARVQADLNQPGASRVTLPFVSLIPENGEAVVAQVQEVQPDGLRLLAPALGPGRYGVRVEDPWARVAQLPGALEVFACEEDTECEGGSACTVASCAEGLCRLTALPDGSPCDDGDACTDQDACAAGTCAGAARTCAPTASCLRARCEPATGACVEQTAPDGEACDDLHSCTGPDSCVQGACGGAPSCGNTPPRACLVVSPTGAVAGDMVHFDARCSTDLEDPAGALAYRFDFDGDGLWDTVFVPEAQAAALALVTGVFRAAVEVRDEGGLSGFATRYWSADDGTGDVRVTTSVDEEDPGANPAAPGGTGLSLREALLWANATPQVRRVLFSPGLSPVQAALPALTRPQVLWVGEPGMTLDFSPASAAGAACLRLAGAGQRLLALDARGCPTALVEILAEQVSLNDVRLTGPGVTGVDVRAAGATLGPLLEARDFTGAGITVRGLEARLVEADVHHNGLGVRLLNSGAGSLDLSVLHHNRGAGVEVHNHGGLVMRACTVHGNAGDGVRPLPNVGGLQAQGSLFTQNGGHGLAGPASGWTQRSPNGYAQNALGPVASGAPAAADLTAGPGYLAPAQGDFRLRPGAQAVDRGVPLGLDHNGPGAGLHFGQAPDLGARESPWTAP